MNPRRRQLSLNSDRADCQASGVGFADCFVSVFRRKSRLLGGSAYC
jgi:hypothetical protein